MLFVVLLWSIGWIYMWLNADVMERIGREKRLLRMPADPVIRFKLVAVVIECYVSRLPLPPLACMFPTRALLAELLRVFLLPRGALEGGRGAGACA